jgi:hypothetical protein
LAIAAGSPTRKQASASSPWNVTDKTELGKAATPREGLQHGAAPRLSVAADDRHVMDFGGTDVGLVKARDHHA